MATPKRRWPEWAEGQRKDCIALAADIVTFANGQYQTVKKQDAVGTLDLSREIALTAQRLQHKLVLAATPPRETEGELEPAA